jgi:hypothetical protein
MCSTTSSRSGAAGRDFHIRCCAIQSPVAWSVDILYSHVYVRTYTYNCMYGVSMQVVMYVHMYVPLWLNCHQPLTYVHAYVCTTLTKLSSTTYVCACICMYLHTYVCSAASEFPTIAPNVAYCTILATYEWDGVCPCVDVCACVWCGINCRLSPSTACDSQLMSLLLCTSTYNSGDLWLRLPLQIG